MRKINIKKFQKYIEQEQEEGLVKPYLLESISNCFDEGSDERIAVSLTEEVSMSLVEPLLSVLIKYITK